MRYFSVAETAKKWNMSERSVRNYCAHGRVTGYSVRYSERTESEKFIKELHLVLKNGTSDSRKDWFV